MELEKIRAADTQVRWQDDDDVDNCRSCKSNFTVTRRKVNKAILPENVITILSMTVKNTIVGLGTRKY